VSGAPAPTVYEQLAGAVRAARPVALVTVVEGPQLGAKLLVLGDTGEVAGTLGGPPELDHRAVWEARGLLARGGTRLVEDCEANTVFVEAFVAPPQMVIFGAIDFTAALVKVAKVLGFRVTVCDARPVFATAQRFPEADENCSSRSPTASRSTGMRSNEKLLTKNHAR
jgi:xanthine dehydrogenase accessory factor